MLCVYDATLLYATPHCHGCEASTEEGFLYLAFSDPVKGITANALAKAAKLEGINVNYKGLGDKAFFEKVMAAGLELFTWTVNSPDVARSLAKLGINGITTDRPAWLRRELSK